MNLSKFSETLGELTFERSLTAKKLAQETGVAAPTITRYLRAERTPTVRNLVLLADFFCCSTDFLLGLESESREQSFRACPPFSEQIVCLAKHFNLSFYAFYHAVGISESSFFEWKNGTSQPTVESLLKIAEHFDRRVDFILGRES